MMMSKMVVSASCTTQRCVLLSTRESNNVRMAHGANVSSKSVLLLVHPQLSEDSIDVYVDDSGAVALAENPLSSVRRKHIYVSCHFLRMLVQRMQIVVNQQEKMNSCNAPPS